MNRSIRSLLLSLVVISGFVQFDVAQEKTPADSHTISLPTSKTLTVPAPGRIGATNGFPVSIVLSPDGRYAAMLNAGYGTQESLGRQSISVLNLQTNEIADFPDARFGEEAHQSYFLGLAFSSDGKRLYASVGSITDPAGENSGDLGDGIAVYSFSDGKVAPERFIAIAAQRLAAGKRVATGLQKTASGTAIPYPGGLALISAAGHDQLLVANNLSDNVVLLDPATGKILQSFDLSTSELVPSSFPYTCVAVRDGRRAWCSLWNAPQLAELDLSTGKIARWIALKRPDNPLAPGPHATAMLLSPDEQTLYVTLANADEVAIVSTKDGTVARWFETKTAAQKYAGTTPTSLAGTADGKLLFVADSSADQVAIFDTAQLGTAPLGMIPTDWYPSALAVHGDDLLIATAKGEGTGPNNGPDKLPHGLHPRSHPYIATLLRGSVARLSIHDVLNRLSELTQIAEQSNLLHGDPGQLQFAGGTNPIKHVIYVIKENRTFDQIMGDLGVGNGDPSLMLYGNDITPNEHKLALQFGVLDNFYDSGEVSGDGHLWSTAAATSDYNEKTWPINYRSKERTYDFQGTVADEFPLEHNQPDVDDPATGFLWDNVAHHGLSYRDYGEFVITDWCNKPPKTSNPKEGTPSGLSQPCPRTVLRHGEKLPPNVGNPHGGPSPWPWDVPLLSRVRPTKAVLRNHFDPLYPDFNTDYPDQLRVDEFMNEFVAYVRARQADENPELQLPAFVLLYLPDDHTGGTRPNLPRPAASVGDNDLALGRVVEAVSHSPYWDDTAILVVEDDAQNGADHVDAHRSTAFVISKYSPGSSAQPYLEHHFYTTVNLIHTLEALLGLPPMNQNDAYAPVMSAMFSGAGNQPVFNADYRNRDNGLIYETNRRDSPGSRLSEKMNFSRPDAAGAARLNEVLWRDRKGDAPMPAPKHSVFPAHAD